MMGMPRLGASVMLAMLWALRISCSVYPCTAHRLFGSMTKSSVLQHSCMD